MPKKPARKKIILNLDLNARAAGFDSADIPTEAHHRIAKNYSSPLLLGPPRTEHLLEMVMHMFSEEDAELVQYLKPMRPKTAQQVAIKAGRLTTEVEKVLDHLALKKMVILAYGKQRKYTILPIVPGTFEMALMTPDLSTRNAWHKKFAELFEQLWESGFLTDYPGKHSTAPVRYLPVGAASDTLYSALPAEKMGEVIESFHTFAVGNCQCRLAMTLIDKGCGLPMENCMAFGGAAKTVISRGMMREISRDEAIAIKKNAEEEGLVNFMMNSVMASKIGNVSCSCCGCCCHALRAIKDFNAPGIMTKPRFMPVYDAEKCKPCKKCINICPMDAWTWVDETLVFNKARCIGCGLCVTVCKTGALSLEEVEKAPHNVDSKWGFIQEALPDYIATSLRVWAKRFLA